MTSDISAKINFTEVYRQLYESVLKSDIASLMTLAYSTWDMPLSVIDASYELLGFQPHVPIGDPTFDAIVATNEISTAMKQRFLDDGYMIEIMKHDEPYVIDWGVTTENHRVAYRLYENDTFYGAISMVLLNSYDWQREDSELFKLIASACTQIMSKRRHSIQAHRTVENWLFATLLETGRLDRESLYILEKKLNRSKNQIFQLIRISNNPYASPFYQEYLERRIRSHFPNVFCDQIHSNIYVLFGAAQKNGLSKLCTQLCTFMQNEPAALMGASRTFFDLSFAAAYRKQADFAFDYAVWNKLSGIQYYENHVMDHILHILQEHLPLKALDEEIIKKLDKYDRENGSDYKETLQFYLLSFLDNKKTTEYFGIHRNTLLHRLNRISQIANIDFDDSEQLIEIVFTLLIQNSMLK